MKAKSLESLFESDGSLRRELFSASARELLEQLRDRLSELQRGMFLPLDLLIVCIERGHFGLAELVAEGASGMVEARDVSKRLERLAEEIEDRPPEGGAQLSQSYFSRGFSRILGEAREQAEGRGGEAVGEEDLVRCLVWRCEAVESASVRWAIRRLSEGKGDELFDDKGLLCESVFHGAIWRVLQGAMKIAASQGTPFLGTPHLVAMLCSVKNSTVWRSAKSRGLEPGRLRKELLRLIGGRDDAIPEFLLGRKTLTPRMIRMLSYASSRAGSEPVEERDIVEGFLDDGGSSLELLQALGLESEIRSALGEPKVLEETFPVDAAIQFAEQSKSTPTLDLLGRDLTKEALDGELPDIVGRENELQRMVNVLLRKEQRNPLLTGEAGVGKTALANGLAERIAMGKVPRQLKGCRLVEINGASLIGGTSYRGDLESRIKSLLEEASEDVILFIDEAHAVFAPRSGTNTPAEVPNHFKRALASGDLAVVGATTEAEYHRWFERDPALKRRFEQIKIDEPDEDLVRQILGTLVPTLERDYGIRVSERALEASINLSVRYLPEEWLPDKGKKLLMDACIARSNDLHADGMSVDEEEQEPSGPREVGREDIARQIHLKTSIPMEQLLKGEYRWWVGLEERLAESVPGQSSAVARVARALVTSRLRNADRQRPMAVLGFVGPPGVGKTAVARTLAEEIFNDHRAVIRLDMSDYQESHSLSRLIGSPPGYVGYEDEDILVTPLRRRPGSVVLLEDFDQAHPRIQERMLRLIEEGEITDTRGHRAEATNALFILTFDAVVGDGGEGIGFGSREGARPSERERADREILGAIGDGVAGRVEGYLDTAIAFDTLGGGEDGTARAMIDRRIDTFVEAMVDEYRLRITIAGDLRERILSEAAELQDVSKLEKLISRWLYDPMTDALLKDAVGDRAALVLDQQEDRTVVREHGEDLEETRPSKAVAEGRDAES